MADITQDQFLQRYGQIMVHLWGMPALLDRFKKEPDKVLKEYGLDPGTAKVTLLKPGTKNDLGITEQTMESQHRLWTEGKAKGNIPFYYVEEPPEGTGGEAISDAELMAVAGGGTISCCCCCSPCCSCC
jgi:hypothetical protein